MQNFDLNRPTLLTRETMAASIFAAAGCYWLYWKNWLLGIIGLLLGASLGFLYKGIGFDLPNQRYRIYTGLFQFRFGRWTTLPAVVGVTIKYFSELVDCGDEGVVRNEKIGCYILMLSVEHASNGIILQRFGLNRKKYVIKLGQIISDLLDVPLATFL